METPMEDVQARRVVKALEDIGRMLAAIDHKLAVIASKIK
jgi:hypothetical protein